MAYDLNMLLLQQQQQGQQQQQSNPHHQLSLNQRLLQQHHHQPVRSPPSIHQILLSDCCTPDFGPHWSLNQLNNNHKMPNLRILPTHGYHTSKIISNTTNQVEFLQLPMMAASQQPFHHHPQQQQQQQQQQPVAMVNGYHSNNSTITSSAAAAAVAAAVAAEQQQQQQNQQQQQQPHVVTGHDGRQYQLLVNREGVVQVRKKYSRCPYSSTLWAWWSVASVGLTLI